MKRKITGIIDDSFPDVIRGSAVVAEWEEEYGYEEKIRDTQEGKKVVKRLVVAEIKNKKLNGVPCEDWFAVKVNGEWRIKRSDLNDYYRKREI